MDVNMASDIRLVDSPPQMTQVSEIPFGQSMSNILAPQTTASGSDTILNTAVTVSSQQHVITSQGYTVRGAHAITYRLSLTCLENKLLSGNGQFGSVRYLRRPATFLSVQTDENPLGPP